MAFNGIPQDKNIRNNRSHLFENFFARFTARFVRGILVQSSVEKAFKTNFFSAERLNWVGTVPIIGIQAEVKHIENGNNLSDVNGILFLFRSHLVLMKFDAVDVVIPVNVAGIQDVLERVKALPEFFHTLEVHSDTGVACLSQPFRRIESDDDFDFDILVGHFGKDSIAYLVLAFDDDFKRMFIIPDTQEAIVSQAQWDRVQELRKNKRRPAKAERQGLFSGLLYCADCGSKLHFTTCKSFEGKQDHYVCSKYKSGRGDCSAHYIREDVLRELVLERIQAVNAYIRSDVEGFQEEWLHYRRADQERDIREDQKRMEQAKKRLATLDVVMSRLYEDYALGEISKEKYKKMTSDYEAEKERLKLEIETTEEWVEQRQAMGDDLDAFIALTKKYVDVTELTQTIVNEYIKKIIIHAPDKSGGKRRQKVEIIFNFVDEVEIPVLAKPMIAESTLGRKKTA